MDPQHYQNLIIIGLGLLAVGAFVALSMKMKGGDITRANSFLTNGLLLKQQSDYVQAEQVLEAAFKIFNNVEPPDYAHHASCAVALASCYERTGKFKEVDEVYRTLLSIWEKQLRQGTDGLVDIDYAVSTSRFGRGTPMVADFYRKVLKRKEAAFGRKHSEYLNSVRILSNLLRDLGYKEEADDLERSAQEAL